MNLNFLEQFFFFFPDGNGFLDAKEVELLLQVRTLLKSNNSYKHW